MGAAGPRRTPRPAAARRHGRLAPVPLRVVLTSDAGLGKSVNLAELAYEINSAELAPAAAPRRCPPPGPAGPSRSFDRTVPHAGGHQPGLRTLRAAGAVPLDRADGRRDADRRGRPCGCSAGCATSGQIVLLFDGLDQLSGGRSRPPTPWNRCCRTRAGQRCPIVVAGRPYALEPVPPAAVRAVPGQWQFVSLDEFTPAEQRPMLGRTADGSRDRYELIHEEAREILGVPRVLEYLRNLDDANLRPIRTPSDVYWFAIRNMLQGDMEQTALPQLLDGGGRRGRASCPTGSACG